MGALNAPPDGPCSRQTHLLTRKEDLSMASYVPNQLFQVPLAELQPDPAQPRKYMDPAALDEMTASIGQVGNRPKRWRIGSESDGAFNHYSGGRLRRNTQTD
ncbi:MAG: hypothetical protein Q7U03_09640 [Syntrophales bacterium]|nr:hypothetical protein [Syntrophales bacterium]